MTEIGRSTSIDTDSLIDDNRTMEPIESILAKKPLSMAVKIELLERFDRFCWRMVHLIRHSNLSWDYGSEDDWLQEAKISLLDAGERFDPGRKVKFITYATHRVWGVLRGQAKKHSGFIKLPHRILEDPESRELFDKFRPGSLMENEDRVDLPEKEIADAGIDVNHFLGTLRSIERSILEQRFGFNGADRRLVAIGLKLGVTKERVRQIQNEALAKLRGRIEKSL